MGKHSWLDLRQQLVKLVCQVLHPGQEHAGAQGPEAIRGLLRNGGHGDLPATSLLLDHWVTHKNRSPDRDTS